MGCCSDKMSISRNKYDQMASSEEEATITMKEKQIPFSTVELQAFEKSIQKHQNNGILSISQFRQAMAELDFDIKIFTIPEYYIRLLLKALQNSKQLFEVKTILLFGIVLCIGTPCEKSEILFKLYDTKNSKLLKKNELLLMIKDIFEVSVIKIPRIAEDNIDEPQTFTLSEEKLNSYIESMSAKEDKFTSKAIDLLIGEAEEITQEEFINRISQEPFLESLVWSFQLRQLLVD